MIVCTENPAPLADLFHPLHSAHDQLGGAAELLGRNQIRQSGVCIYVGWRKRFPGMVVFQTDSAGPKCRCRAPEIESSKVSGSFFFIPPCLEFIEAFFGCQFAGAIPVPAFPPRKSRNGGRIDLIAQDADAKLVFTNRETITRMENMLDETECLKEIPILASEEIPDGLSDEYKTIDIQKSDIGLLQYTSGSTGSPKGVILTHGNLIENCKMITHAVPDLSAGQRNFLAANLP